MPKKVVKKQKQKQKQSQKQNVKQTVIIKLDKEGKKIKRRRKITRREPSDGVSTMERALPPPVIYQGSYPVQINPPPTPNLPLQAAPTIKNIAPPLPREEMQDVGIGTEGLVSILDVPTKREQLQDLITPVSKAEPSFQYDYPEKPKPIPSEYFSKKIEELRSMKEPMIAPIRTRRNKKEMAEARQMEREDIASINLGLAQFEPSFEKPQISKGLNEERASEPIKKEPNIPEAFTPLFAESRLEKPLSKTGKPIESLMTAEDISEEQNIPESVLKGKRVNFGSWNYWLSKYEELTGQRITEYKAKQQFGSKEKFAEFINSNLK